MENPRKGWFVFGCTKTQMLKDNAASATELATALAKDKKFRKQLLSAAGHGVIARRRAARRIGFLAAVSRLTGDPKLKRELRKMTQSLEKAWSRVERKRSRKLRTSLLVVAGAGGAVAAAVPLRRKFASSGLPGPKGNRELVLHLVQTDRPTLPDDLDARIEAAVASGPPGGAAVPPASEIQAREGRRERP